MKCLTSKNRAGEQTRFVCMPKVSGEEGGEGSCTGREDICATRSYLQVHQFSLQFLFINIH